MFEIELNNLYDLREHRIRLLKNSRLIYEIILISFLAIFYMTLMCMYVKTKNSEHIFKVLSNHLSKVLIRRQ